MVTQTIAVQAEKVSHKRGAVDVDFDEIEAEVLAQKKRKKKSSAKGKSPGKDSCTKGSEQEQEADRQRRIEAMRKKVKDDFAVEVDDDDDDSEIECGDAPQAPATLRTQHFSPSPHYCALTYLHDLRLCCRTLAGMSSETRDFLRAE